MKNLMFLLIFTLSFYCFNQEIYSSFKNQDFKDLISNGFVFEKTGEKSKDSLLLAAFEKHWKATTFRIEEKNSNTTTDEDIVVIESSIFNGNKALIWIKKKNIIEGKINPLKTIGFVYYNGFVRSDDLLSTNCFLNEIVSGFNEIVTIIQAHKIEYVGANIYKQANKSISKRSSSLKNKTLLILDNAKESIYFDAINEAKIAYKLISLKEFMAIPKDERSEFCLLYFSKNTKSTLAIYDLENEDLIYFKVHNTSKLKIMKSDIKDIKKNW